jgi:hypothetical protein
MGFIKACKHGNLEEVKHLLSLTGSDRTDVHANYERAFRLACYCGQLEVIKLLLNLTGDRYINVHGIKEAFQWAYASNCLEVIKLLLSLTGDRYIHFPIDCITSEQMATLVLQRFREQHRARNHFLESCHNGIMYLRVKEELLHIPAGEIHPSFPGGLKYHETIGRLVK